MLVVSKLTCPSCAARLTSAKPLPAGSRVRCPQCGVHFRAPATRPRDSRPPRRPDRIPELLDIIYGPKGPCSPAMSQESSQEPENTKGHPGRHRALVVGAAVVLLVVLGISVALATSGTRQQKPEPDQKVAKVEDSPKQIRVISDPQPAAPSKAALPPPEPPGQPAGAGGTQVLAPGEPPLTQEWLNRWFANTEWLLDIRLTEQQCRQCQQLWVQHWKGTNQFKKDRFWVDANAELQWSSEAAKRGEAERNDLRAQKQHLVVAALRKSSDPDERLLLELYEAAHRPGGEKNPLLVTGTSPLAQGMVDRSRRFIEWILDVRLTEQQRQEYQHLFISDWIQARPAANDTLRKTATEDLLGQLSLLNNYNRNLLCAGLRPKFLAGLRNSSGAELSRWLLAVYESAHRPGGERNPVLVPGDPPLTQGMVSAYGDFIEWILGLQLSGGLTGPQRLVLREMIIDNWKQNDGDGKDLLELLTNWTATAQLSEAERTRLHARVHAEFLSQLRGAGDQELSRWLLAIYQTEQNQRERQAGNGRNPRESEK